MPDVQQEALFRPLDDNEQARRSPVARHDAQ
jgi:hypothetical protein